jgi:hypothetical protein
MEDPPCFDGRQFCYEAMWELQDDLKPTIANGWTATPGKAADGLSVKSVQGKLKGLAGDLK